MKTQESLLKDLNNGPSSNAATPKPKTHFMGKDIENFIFFCYFTVDQGLISKADPGLSMEG